MKENYQKVAYIGLRSADKYQVVPLFIKLESASENVMTDEEKELTKTVASIFINHYEKKISQHITKSNKGEQNNG